MCQPRLFMHPVRWHSDAMNYRSSLRLLGLPLVHLAMGGLALGILAAGGAAVALDRAFGGLAVARDVAMGGVALAAHANDAVAREAMAHGLFFRNADRLIGYSRLLMLVPVLVVIWQATRMRLGPVQR